MRTVAEILQLVINDQKASGRASTKENQMRLNKHLLPFFGGRTAEELTVDDINDYKIKRQEAGAAVGTIHRELSLLRSAYNLSRLQGPKISTPKSQESDPRETYWQHGEYLRFMEAAKATAAVRNYNGPLVADIVSLGYKFGFRLREALQIHRDWINTEQRLIVIPKSKTKNRKKKVVPLDEESWAIIEARLQNPSSDGLLFHRAGKPAKSIRGMLSACLKRAGLPDKSFHDLRRSAVTNLCRAGVDPEVGKKISGHASDVFFQYNQVRVEQLREAVNKVNTYLGSKTLPQNGPPPGAQQMETVQGNAEVTRLESQLRAEREQFQRDLTALQAKLEGKEQTLKEPQLTASTTETLQAEVARMRSELETQLQLRLQAEVERIEARLASGEAAEYGSSNKWGSKNQELKEQAAAVAQTEAEKLIQRLQETEEKLANTEADLKAKEALLQAAQQEQTGLFFTKGVSLDSELAEYEKSLLLYALRESDNVQKRAAKLLGIDYRSFRYRLEKHGIVTQLSAAIRSGLAERRQSLLSCEEIEPAKHEAEIEEIARQACESACQCDGRPDPQPTAQTPDPEKLKVSKRFLRLWPTGRGRPREH